MIVYGDPETWGMKVDQFLDSRRLERESFADGTNPKIKMILDMLRRGMDVDTISTITGATVEEINNIAKTAKPISTEELSPEEPLSKNKTYSEIDILSNIDAKNPGGITGEDVVINPMPNPVPRMDEYMPEAEVIEDPRYRQLELADGGVVQREGFKDGINHTRNPTGKNQYEQKSIEEIIDIIKNNPNYNAKDLRGKTKINKIPLLTRRDIERAKKEKGIVPGKTGKHKLVSPRGKDIRRLQKLKPVQGGVIMLEGSRKLPTGQVGHGKEFSHIYPFMEGVPQTTKMTGVISGTMNRKLQPFNVIGQKITDQQKQLIAEEPNNKRKIMELNAKAKRNAEEAVAKLGKEYKANIGYYQVDPDTLDIKLKAGNWKNTFAGVKGKEESFLEMGGKGRYNFQKEQSKKIIDQFLKGKEKLETIVENIGCPTGALKAANGANCYIKGAEKIQAGKLNQNEFNVLQKAVKSPAVAKAVKYGGVALKGLGALFAPLMVYDTYTEYKKGKPISEALEYGLLGTNIIGGTRDELKLTPREREARGVQQQYEREQQDVSGLSSDFYFPSDLSVDQAAKIYEQGQDRVAAERAAEEEQAALENVYQGDPGILDYSEYAYGGRVGLEKGSDPKNKPILPINPMIGGEDPRGSLQDPGRRDVLKGMGLLGAGVAAGKLGLLKLGKAIKKAPLTSIVKPMGKTMTQFPTWFPTLVNRIRKEGTQIPIFKTKDVNISKQEYDALKQQGTKNLFDQYIGRTENYVNELKQQGIPRYYQKVNTDEIIGYKYEVKDLPNVKVTDLAGKEIRIDFPNAYGKDVTMTYKAPKVSVDMQGKKVKYDAEFQVDDAVPESGGYPDDVPDFYGEIVNNLDEVYGGASQIEQYALKLKKPRTTQGDEVVNAWDAGQPHMSVKEIRELELKKQKKQGRRDYAKQQVDEKPATFEDREFLKNFLDAGDDID
jgi:hypothetical protein